MKRKLTVTFDGARDVQLRYFNRGQRSYVIEGEFAYTVENLQRFVDVKLLDANNVSLNQQDMTWTYEDTLPEPLKVGDYVLVPFGWRAGEYLAKVVTASNEPTYTGSAPIKQVAGRLVSEF